MPQEGSWMQQYWKQKHYVYLTYKSAWYFFPFRMSNKVGAWLFLKFRLESYTAAAARDAWQQLAVKSFDLQIHANNPTAHQFLWGFEQLPRILWSWVEGDTSVWVNLCSLPPACWPGASLVWSVFLHRTAKTTPGKTDWLLEAVKNSESQNGAETYPEVLWVIMQVLEALCDGAFVLFPLPFTENYLQEVPHPANDRYIT